MQLKQSHCLQEQASGLLLPVVPLHPLLPSVQLHPLLPLVPLHPLLFYCLKGC
jgi:hypothetical protein